MYTRFCLSCAVSQKPPDMVGDQEEEEEEVDEDVRAEGRQGGAPVVAMYVE